MQGDKEYYKHRLERARKQRLIALKAAFKIIDAFAQPSYTPDIYADYERVKNYLIKQYSEK